MNYHEEALRFDCDGAPLLGVVSRPERPGPVALLVVVGGPQYRAGAHRLFVRIARDMAAAGHATMRFDFRGCGDSGGEPAGFEAVHDDIGAAIDATLDRLGPEVRHVALWGLCDGASAALMYLQRRADPRVKGLLLMNPWVRSAQSLSRARLKQYYLSRLAEPAFWRKLLSGGVGLSALSGLAAHMRSALGRTAPAELTPDDATLSFQDRMLRGWSAFAGPIQLVLSGRDLTAAEFEAYVAADAAWQQVLQRGRHRELRIPDADHTFSDPASASQLSSCSLAWLDGIARAL